MDHEGIRTLADYPFVVVRVECNLCVRRGRYRVACLAERYGASITLEDLLDQIAGARCRHPRPWRVRRLAKMSPVCRIMLPDLVHQPRPPDTPPRPLHVVAAKSISDAA